MSSIPDQLKGKIKRRAAQMVAKFMTVCPSHAKAKKAALICVDELMAQFDKEFAPDYDATNDSHYVDPDIKYSYKMALFDYLKQCISSF